MGREGLRKRVERFFAEGGPLARRKEGYRPRPEQVRFALEVATTLEREAVLLSDCPTGLGKSLGYLVPAVLRGERVVVSTATIALQHQLLGHELPLLDSCVREFTQGERGVSFGLLKGRGNFLCEGRLQAALGTGSLFGDEGDALEDLAAWAAEEGATGDREDLPFRVPVRAWREVASDADDCAPKRCAFRERCFYFAKRREVSRTDVLVVNHSMLMANAASDYNVFDMEGRHLILDEAHRVENVMSSAFGAHVTRPRIGYVARAVSRRTTNFARYTEEVESSADLFFDALRTHARVGEDGGVPPHYGRLQEALASLAKLLRSHPHEEVNKLAGMVYKLVLDLSSFYGPLRKTHAHAVLPAGGAPGAAQGGRRNAYPELKSWLVDTGEEFRETVAARPGGGATALTSATLAPDDSFDYPRKRLGLDPGSTLPAEVREFRGKECFDYANNALVYVPRDLPDPKADRPYLDACVGRTGELVALSGGRALVVLASWRALEHFRKRFAPEGFEVRFQGDDTVGNLTRWLKTAPKAVLVGTATMREGIDVPGEALSLLVMDKPPFPHPDDKVIGALCERAGRRWFREVSMPRAQVALRQGAGRLIRTATDRGVVAVLDPRLSTKGWGPSMLRALPPAPKTASLEDVRAFFVPGRRDEEEDPAQRRT